MVMVSLHNNGTLRHTQRRRKGMVEAEEDDSVGKVIAIQS